MANCLQSFKFINSNKKFRELFGKPFSEEFLLNSDYSEVWQSLENEIIEEIVKKSNEDKAINSYSFSALSENINKSIEQNKEKFLKENSLLDEQLNELDMNLSELSSNIIFNLKNILVKEGLVNTNPTINGERLFNFNNPSKLTYGVVTYENFKDNLISNSLFETLFIKTNRNKNYPYEGFVTNDNQLNKNLSIYKNELWDYMFKYYSINNPNARELPNNSLYLLNNVSAQSGYGITLNEELFYKTSNDNTSIYEDVMSFIKSEMDHTVETNISSTKILQGNKFTVARAYINSLVLANFDNYLLQNHSDLVSVNLDGVHTFNLPTNGNPKYKLNFSWGKKAKLDNSGISDISDNKTSLVKLISDVIPFYSQNKKNGKWVPNEYGLNIGKSNLDSIGAIINSIDIDEVFNINGVERSMGSLLIEYDNGNIKFQDILNALLKSEANRSISAREPVIRSIYEFLYGSQGIAKAARQKMLENPNLADYILNPETVVINHLRNTVKNVYNKVNVLEKSRVIDYLDLDIADEFKYTSLLHGLDEAWKLRPIKTKEYEVNSLDGYINFLSSKDFGNLELSDNIKKQFKLKLEEKRVDVTSEPFKTAFKLLSDQSFYDTYLKTTGIDEYSKDKSVGEYIEILKWSPEAEHNLLLKDLFVLISRNTKFSTVTQYKKDNGKNMPTMGVANLAALLPIALQKGENYFTKRPQFYKRTQIISELVGHNGPKDFDEVTAEENFKVAFIKHFLESRVLNKEMVAQPVNYSDKVSINGIVVNTVVNLENGKNLFNSSSEDIKNELFSAQSKYYDDLKVRLFKDYTTLFGKPINNFNSLQRKLDEINKKAISENIDPKEALNTLINKHFEKNKGKNYFEITEELHYSLYKTTVEVVNPKTGEIEAKSVDQLKVNQFLKSYIDIFSNETLFEKWADNIEKAHMEANPFKKIPLKEVNFDDKTHFGKTRSIKHKQAKLKQNFKGITYNEKNDIIYVTPEGKLSEIGKQFLWGKNLIISQYLNATVKDAFLHPTKTGFVEMDLIKNFDKNIADFIKEEDLRTTAFTKRMNIFGASMNVLGKNDTGILSNHKIAVLTNPVASTFNYTGNKHLQDVMDGGGLLSGIFNNLVKSSLPGYNLQSTQKPIAESITNKTSTTLKFATFAISNEEIRKSEMSDTPLYNIFKKMHDIPIWEGNNYVDLFKIPNLENKLISQEIDILEFAPDFYMEHLGSIKKVVSVKNVKDNVYAVTFENGTQKEFTVNTIMDLWEGLGGTDTYNLVGKNTFKQNEYSIEIISSLMNKHHLSQSGLNLKDKMIAMAVMQTAVKKGATNINNFNEAFSLDGVLSYMNFDMSFYGIQLDSFHSTEDSQVNEITQVMSAIAEKASTPELYNLVYQAISNVVDRGLEKFSNELGTFNGKQDLIGKFIKNINSSSQINNARNIINGLQKDVKKLLPLNNKAIYKQLVSFLIAETNAEFIRRKFPGTSSVLRPSYGFMQIFEDKKGNKYMFDDLLKKFKNSGAKIEGDITELSRRDFNIARVAHLLENDPDFSDDPISIRSIRPLDTIKLNIPIEVQGIEYNAGDIISVKDYDQYYELKDILFSVEGVQISRVYTKPRDLKPVDITFNQVINEENIERSIWDSEAFWFKWKLKTDKNFKDSFLYKQFKEYVLKVDPFSLQIIEDTIPEYVDRWIGRTFDLTKKGKTFKFLSEILPENGNIFEQLFSMDNGKIDAFRYRFSDNYINFNEITDYTHRNPENIHSNVFKNNFGFDRDMSIPEISEEIFNLDKNKLARSKKDPYDIVIQNSLSEESLYVVLEDFNYYFDKDSGNLYSLIAIENIIDNDLTRINELSPVASKIEIFTNEKGDKRINEYGDYMYDLPSDYEFFKTNSGKEVLFLKNISKGKSSLDNLRNFLTVFTNFDYLQTRDIGYNTIDQILGKQSDDKYLKLLRVVSESSNNKELRKYINNKENSYKAFRKIIADSKKVSAIDRKKIAQEYIKYIKTAYNSLLDNYIGIVAKIRAKSVELSLKSISARIPAQAMQSFMGMDTVGFISGDSNDVYVSHWQLFLQGSDYDIDKIYMMMYSFTNGYFDTWSPSFDIIQFEESRKIPLPTNKTYTVFSDPEGFKVLGDYTVNKGETTTIEKRVNELIPLDDKRIFNIDEFLVSKGFTEEDKFLPKFIAVLNELNANHRDIVYSKDKGFLKALNKHQSYYSEEGFKNFIVDKLLLTTQDPSNQIASSSQISIGVYGRLRKEIESGKRPLRNLDGYTSGIQQEINIIGKKVIGIAATGLKDYFALVKYFNDYFQSETFGKHSVNSNKYFFKHYNINGKDYYLDRVEGIEVSEDIANIQNELLRKSIMESLQDTQEWELHDGISKEDFIKQTSDILSQSRHIEDVALVISAILSLATDNAKELMLSKINAGIDFAGIHLYLIMLGVNPEDVTKFMIHPLLKEISKEGKTDSFVKTTFKTVPDLITAKYENASEEELKVLENFYNIYYDSRELVTLGSYLKVNQGSKATEEELEKLIGSVHNTILIQEGYLLNKHGIQKSKNSDISDTILDAVVRDKPYLDNAYLNNVITKAVKFDIINKGINVYRFFNDPNYQEAVISYYNIIKSTFNILDVLISSDHFSSMFNSFVEVNEILTNWTNKHYFTRPENINKVLDAIIESYGKLNYSISKNITKRGVSLLGPEIMGRVNDYYDNAIIYHFFKKENLTLDIGRLMKMYNLDKIKILSEEIQEVKYNEVSYKALETYQFGSNEVNEPYLLKVNSPLTIAIFRQLMEDYIIPNEKVRHRQNGFLSKLVKNKQLIYNLKNKISY